MRIQVWHGTRGSENETVEFVEFDGEEVGEIKEATEKREKQTAVYRVADGRIVIREVWIYPQGEEKARVWFFATIDKAREYFGWVLEILRLHPSPRARLGGFYREWD